jgi:adenylate kinase family enzyme
LKEPTRFTKEIKPTPSDLSINPRVVVLGLPKSGKSALCKRMAERIGCVHLQMSKVIQGFMNGDSVESNLLRRTMLEDGRSLSDDMIVSLL